MGEELVYEFNDGPYDVLNYSVKMEDGKAVIDLNDNDLGRITIESVEAVEELQTALDMVKEELQEVERRQEEL